MYCPPGISWSYTSDEPLFCPDSKAAYEKRTVSQYSISLDSSCSSTPVSRSPFCSAATKEPIDGWLVMPDIESTAQSTASAPAAEQASIEATPVPAVSWVCTWIGKFGNSLRSAEMSVVAAAGLSRPAMSLMQSTWMLYSTSCRARSSCGRGGPG